MSKRWEEMSHEERVYELIKYESWYEARTGANVKMPLSDWAAKWQLKPHMAEECPDTLIEWNRNRQIL